MIQSEAEFAELEPESFEFMKRLDADVNVDLLSKTFISVVSDEHHRHPVVSCVSRWLFIATAIYIFHTKFSPVAPSIGAGEMPAARDKKSIV